MGDTLLALILLCSVQSTSLNPQCVFVADKHGPAGSRIACRERLDDMWLRIEADSDFIIRTTKEIGDFKLTQEAHMGYCVNPEFDQEKEIGKYTF